MKTQGAAILAEIGPATYLLIAEQVWIVRTRGERVTGFSMAGEEPGMQPIAYTPSHTYVLRQDLNVLRDYDNNPKEPWYSQRLVHKAPARNVNSQTKRNNRISPGTRVMAFLRQPRKQVRASQAPILIATRPASRDSVYERVRIAHRDEELKELATGIVKGFKGPNPIATIQEVYVLENRLDRIGTPAQNEVVPVAVLAFEKTLIDTRVLVFEPTLKYSVPVRDRAAFLRTYLARNPKLDITMSWKVYQPYTYSK